MLRFKNRISLHCILACVYFLMLPLTIVTNSVGASFLKIASLPIGIYFVVSLVFYKQEFQINLVHIALALFTIATAFTLFVANDRNSIVMVMGYFLNAALYISLSVVIYNETEHKIFDYVQIVLLVIVVGLTLLDNSLGEADRETLTIMGQACDPNYFVGFVIFPLAVTMEKIVKSKWRIFYIALAALAMYAVLLSGSRGGLLAVVVTMVAFAIIYPKGLHRKLIVLALLVGGLIVFWIVVLPILPQNIVERMSVQAILETRGTYRGDIWASMINEIKNSSWELFVGRGIDAKHIMMVAGQKSVVVAHNYLIQLVYNQGIIGLVSFLILLVVAVGRCIKKRKCVAIAFIGMMTLALSLSINPSIKTLWNLVPYAAFVFIDSDNEGGKS